MMKFVVFVLCFVLKSQVFGQISHFGTCPYVPTVKLFDIERFLGTWYVLERYPTWYENRGNCSYKRFLSCGTQIEIQHIFVRDNIEYYLHVNSTYKPGAEAVFKVEPNSIDAVGIPLSVIDTDYDSYAVVYGCKENEMLNIKYFLAWILSREVTLPPEILKEARRTLTSVPYSSVAYLEEVTQDKDFCVNHWTAHIHAVNTSSDTVD